MTLILNLTIIREAGEANIQNVTVNDNDRKPEERKISWLSLVKKILKWLKMID